MQNGLLQTTSFLKSATIAQLEIIWIMHLKARSLKSHFVENWLFPCNCVR
jgi:hypothetical protein